MPPPIESCRRSAGCWKAFPKTSPTSLAGWSRKIRLGDTEALLLSNLAGQMPGGLDNVAAAGCYPVPRQDSHAWFAVAGPAAKDCLAKLCGVDLRPRAFTAGAVAQCGFAGISAIVIRDDALTGYHLLADSASAGYLWDCLIDAMAEYGGGPVGRAGLVKDSNR